MLQSPASRYSFQSNQFKFDADGYESDDVDDTLDPQVTALNKENDLKSIRDVNLPDWQRKADDVYLSSSLDLIANLKNKFNQQNSNNSFANSARSINWKSGQDVKLKLGQDLRIEDVARIGTECVKVDQNKFSQLKSNAAFSRQRSDDQLQERVGQLLARRYQKEDVERCSRGTGRRTPRRLPQIPAGSPLALTGVSKKLSSTRGPGSSPPCQAPVPPSSLAAELQEFLQAGNLDENDAAELTRQWFPVNSGSGGGMRVHRTVRDLGTPDLVDPENKYDHLSWSEVVFVTPEAAREAVNELYKMTSASVDQQSLIEKDDTRANDSRMTSSLLTTSRIHSDVTRDDSRERDHVCRKSCCITSESEQEDDEADDDNKHQGVGTKAGEQQQQQHDESKRNDIAHHHYNDIKHDTKQEGCDISPQRAYQTISKNVKKTEEENYKNQKKKNEQEYYHREEFCTAECLQTEIDKNDDEYQRKDSQKRKTHFQTEIEANVDNYQRNESKTVIPDLQTETDINDDGYRRMKPGKSKPIRPTCLPDLITTTTCAIDPSYDAPVNHRNYYSISMMEQSPDELADQSVDVLDGITMVTRSVDQSEIELRSRDGVADQSEREDEVMEEEPNVSIPPRRRKEEKKVRLVACEENENLSIGQKYLKERKSENIKLKTPVKTSFFTLSGKSSPDIYLDETDATHRGCHKFVPRHPEELAIEIGDPIYVDDEADDLWCEGVNLRTKERGVFPTAYATDLSMLDGAGSAKKSKYFAKFLGSIEVSNHQGHDVLCHAVNKLVARRQKAPDQYNQPLCSLEIDESGIKMTDRSKKKVPFSRFTSGCSVTEKLSRMLSLERSGSVLTSDHFFSLKNICFCGYHPKNDKYFGFITKHPIEMRFACHVYQRDRSTREIVDCIGGTLQSFYQQYLACVHPTEDIYME